MNEQNDGKIARHLLFVSGLIGITIGLGIEWYRLILLDPVFGGGEIPTVVGDLQSALLVGSTVVIIYGLVIENLFGELIGYILTGAVFAQWGLPTMMLLETTAGGIRNLFGYFVLIFGGLHVLIAASVAISYTYWEWPESLPGIGFGNPESQTTEGQDEKES